MYGIAKGRGGMYEIENVEPACRDKYDVNKTANQ